MTEVIRDSITTENESKECQNCGAEVSEINDYNIIDFPAKKENGDNIIRMCKLCASSQSGNVGIYPWTELSNNQVAQTICFVGNEILKAIKERSVK